MADEDTQDQGQEGQSDTPTPEPDKGFTQEDVNKMMAKVRREERQKFGDYDDLKTKAERLSELEAEQLSKEEKLQADLDAANKRAADTEARIERTAIDSEIRVKAAQMGLVDADAALALVDRNAIAYQDGSVAGVDDALTTLVEARPWLKGSTPSAPNLNGGSKGEPPAGPKLTADQLEAAEKLGLKPEDYAKGLAGGTNGRI